MSLKEKFPFRVWHGGLGGELDEQYFKSLTAAQIYIDTLPLEAGDKVTVSRYTSDRLVYDFVVD